MPLRLRNNVRDSVYEKADIGMRLHDKRVSGSMVFAALMSLWIGLILMVPKLTWAGTAMGDLAASMKPGTWAELSTHNLDVVLSASGASGSILAYAEDGAWDTNLTAIFLYRR